MKKCSKCGETKELTEFHKDSSEKDGRRVVCKVCMSAYAATRYQANASTHKDTPVSKKCSRCGETKVAADYHRNNASKDGLDHRCKACIRVYFVENREAVARNRREWRKNNAEHRAEYRKSYNEANKESVRLFSTAYCAKRKKIDPYYKLLVNLRTLLHTCLTKQGYTKKSKTEVMLGCTFPELLAHLGERPQNAHLDHICPCAQAQNEQELIRLQHFTNLRWLSAEENLAKGDKKTTEAEEKCRILLDREWID